MATAIAMVSLACVCDLFAAGLNNDLSVTVDNGEDAVEPGDSVAYTINISGSGPDFLTDATLTTSAVGLVNCTWICLADPGAACGAMGGNGLPQETFSIDDENILYTVFCTVDPGLIGNTVSLTAMVAPPAGDMDPDNDNNSDTDTDGPPVATDLSVTLSVDQDYAAGGDTLVYSIEAYADGDTAEGVGLSNPIPVGLENCAWTCSGQNGSVCTGPAAGSGDVDTTATLDPAGSLSVVFTCDVSATFGTGTLENVAALSVPPWVEDPDTEDHNAAASTQITVCGEPDFISLHNGVVLSSETYIACLDLEAGNNFFVSSTGDLALIAGAQVALKPGFSVAVGAILSATVDPSLQGE